MRRKQNIDTYRKLYLAAFIFIFVQLFFIVSDIVTGFYWNVSFAQLNLMAEVLILGASVLVMIVLLFLDVDDDQISCVQFAYYFLLETGFLLYICSDTARGLGGVSNAFYNMVVLVVFATYHIGFLSILTGYIFGGTLAILLVLDKGAVFWGDYQVMILLLILFFACANFFRINNTKLFFSETRMEGMAARLEELSMTDSLTKMGNRVALNSYVKSQVNPAVSAGQSLGLLMMDIDDFKAYNDVHSHTAGDKCLNKISRAFFRLQYHKFRAFRFGGEKFLFIAIGVTAQELCAFAGLLVRMIYDLDLKRKEHINGSDRVTASIGCAFCQAYTEDAYTMLLAAANEAMYSAKRSGKNCYWYDNARYTM